MKSAPDSQAGPAIAGSDALSPDATLFEALSRFLAGGPSCLPVGAPGPARRYLGAATLLGALYEAAAPGGQLLIGNVDVSNPTRYFMEYFAEWFLIHRSRSQLLDMTRLLRPAPAAARAIRPARLTARPSHSFRHALD